MRNCNLSTPIVTNCTFSDNYADDDGGAMLNSGQDEAPRMTNFTLIGNYETYKGGGMHKYTQGAILTNCTFSGNHAAKEGGGMCSRYDTNPTVTNCTFIGNSAGGLGDGISNQWGASLTMKNTILAENGAIDLYNDGYVHSSYDIVEDYVGFSPDATDITGEQPGLNIGPLADNGGDIWTHALLPGSVAIDAGTASGAPATDQRGVPRDSLVDIGAYESRIVYVDTYAAGANDGTSWTDAYTDLQGALENAVGGDEIWVANGTYKPTASADRTISFVLPDGVGLYGGFAGGETERGQRDSEANTTTLSGDIGIKDDDSDNSYHVVWCGSATNRTVLDGFRISGGYADGIEPADHGGGMHATAEGGLEVTSCTFCGNYADYGGGMQNTGSLAIANCTFSGNSAGYGGGMHNTGSPEMTNCTFIGNSATYDGDGIYNDVSAVLAMKNTILADNGAEDLYNAATVDSSHNIVETYTGFIPDVTDIAGEQPGLNVGPLIDNGGGALTHALLEGSVAIDAGTASGAPATDQRGALRDASPDIGAYEYHLPLIYVDSDAAGANDGKSWTDAFTNLQDAMDFAFVGDEIWVAAGTYKPTDGADRTVSFVLKDGVGIYGGFAGGETSRDQRDREANPTALSGDIGAEGDHGDNSHHVVKCGTVAGVTVLDGFAIRRGNADGVAPDDRGGGMLAAADGNLEVVNCIFEDNSATEGGGMYNADNGSPVLIDCAFGGNTASNSGGGMYNADNGSPVLIDCGFGGNTASNSGGGMYNADNGSPELTGCAFGGNSAYGNGGGMHNADDGSPALTACTFSGNSALNNGGGIYNDGVPVLINCTFSGNVATLGGGMDNRGAAELASCTFVGNVATGDGGGIYNAGSAELTMTNTILADNEANDLHSDATVVSSFNIVETYVGFVPDATDIAGDQPDLNIGPLADNGGPTQTRALLAGSVAIDAGTASGAPATDQRGYARDASPDIGAYERQPPIYVDSGAGGANDGGSWTDAFTDLQGALAAALFGDEIWVAAGTYKPTPGTDRAVSFVLKDGVGLYGGFEGVETERDQRDWKTYATVLSGDIGAAGDDGDNSLHVVRCESVGDRTVLDGFSIAGGNADGAEPDDRGGGMFAAAGSDLQVSDCAFESNNATYGGGMHVVESNPTVAGCAFGNNTATEGGGMRNIESSPNVIRCTFTDNTATDGGGMRSVGGSPIVKNCTFNGNSAESGGGMLNDGGAPEAVNCTFAENTATGHGGAISNVSSAVLTLKNTILADNGAEDLHNEATVYSSFSIVENYSGFAPDATDIPGDQPDLNVGPLADNGGDTWTRALLPGSVAINAGTAVGTPTKDQRGVARDASPDIGAYEYQNIFYVAPAPGDCGGNAPCYSSIGDAIDDAGDGGVLVRVAEGEYFENVVHDVDAIIEFGCTPDFASQAPATPVILRGPDGN